MRIEEEGYLSEELEYLIDVKHRQQFINEVRRTIRDYNISLQILKDALLQFKVYRVTQISNKNANEFIEKLITTAQKQTISNPHINATSVIIWH